MSSIQNFKNEWVTKLNTNLAENQQKVDLYLSTRQTAIALTDPVGTSGSFSLPALKVLNIKDDFTLPPLNATKLGDIFEWSYPMTGPDNFSKDSVIYKIRPKVVDEYQYSSDVNLKNLAIQYKSLISSNSINDILKSNSIGFQYIDSLKKLRDAGVDTLFDNWMRAVYSTIAGSKIKVSTLKETDYSELFIRFERDFSKCYKGYYVDGARLTSPSNLLYLATVEAGDNYFNTTQSILATSSQLDSNDWIISVINPSDNTRKIQGVINFTRSQDTIAIATINNLPVSYTNPITGKTNINEIGSLTSKVGPESSTDESLADKLIGNLESLIKTEYGITLKLKYDKSSDVSRPDQSLVDLPVASTASQIAATQSSELPLKDFIFNVEIQDTFTNSDLGSLTILRAEDETLLYESGEILDNLSAEYLEDPFEGQDEVSFEQLISEDSINIEALNDVKGYDPENPDSSLTDYDIPKYKVSKNGAENKKVLIQVMGKLGITNKFTKAAILAICQKESGFVPKNEATYAKTSASRIKAIFSSMRKYSDAEVDSIKKNPKKFFDIIYGSKYGNGPSDGYNYRGRGFNQITFKDTYKKYGAKTGKDLVGDPDLLNTVEVAAEALVYFFKAGMKMLSSEQKGKYRTSGDINDFKTLEDAVGAMYHINAGLGNSYATLVKDPTGGRKKAFAYSGDLYKGLA